MVIFSEKKLRTFIIPLTCLIIALFIFESKVRNSSLFDLASTFFKNDERVSSRIGEVKGIGLNILGTKLWRDKARIGLKLTGDNGSIPAWAWFKKTRNEWTIYEAGIMQRKGVRLSWVPITVESPQGAFYALKTALKKGDYDKAWSYCSDWAKGTGRPDFETFKQMAKDKNSLVYAISEAKIIDSGIGNNSAVLILTTGVITIRMEVVKEEGIWKIDGWKEIEKVEGKKVAI